MSKGETWTPGKRLWRKPLMRRQRQCSNHLPAPAIWTQDISGRTGLQRKRRGTLERISPPTASLLIHLVENSHFPLSRLPPLTQRNTGTINEVPGIAEDGDRDVIPTLLPWISISFPKKKGETCPKSSVITTIRKDITPTSILRIQRNSKKTSDSLDNFYASNCS